MSKRKPTIGISGAQMHIAMVEENNRKMRERANPCTREMMDEVQTAIDDENKVMGAQFEAETNMRVWAKDLLRRDVTISELEALNEQISRYKINQVSMFGDTFLIKTSIGTIDRVDRYFFVLENTILDLSKKITV